jgi:hypothetical protein
VVAAADRQKLAEFKGAPIVVARKTLRDAINLQMTKQHSLESKHAMHVYRSRDQYQKQDLTGEHQDRLWRAHLSVTKDNLGLLPLVGNSMG